MRFLNSLFMAALVAPSVASANELTRVYDLALQNDTTLQAAVGARESVVETLPQARGALLPQINGFGSLESGDSTTTINQPNSPPPNQFGPTDSPDETRILQLQLRQALFDAAAWNR